MRSLHRSKWNYYDSVASFVTECGQIRARCAKNCNEYANSEGHRSENLAIVDTMFMDAQSDKSEMPPAPAASQLFVSESRFSVFGQAITVLRIGWVVLLMYLKLQCRGWLLRHRKHS